MITNKVIIEQWSNVAKKMIQEIGDEGDFHRRYLLNPAITELLPEVCGKHILDAGCGNGYLIRKLTKMGATGTGVEPADNLYQYATRREKVEKRGIEYIKTDLSRFRPKDKFDIVIANMVFMDIPDYEKAMANCINSLKFDGILIFSILHPCFDTPGRIDWKNEKEVRISNYFNKYQKEQEWCTAFHRTLSDYSNCLLINGCSIIKIIEPRLPKEVAEEFPDESFDYYIPGFLVVKAVRNMVGEENAIASQTEIQNAA